MSVYQVEEYYISLDSSQIDFTEQESIAAYINDNHGADFSFDADYLHIDGFDSEGAAEDFQDELMNEFGM